MANSVVIELDLTAPGGVVLSFPGARTSVQQVDVTITCPAADKYQMKLWGSVDPTFDANVQTTEGASSWITFTETKTIRLSDGDALKTLNLKVRDDVYNESTTATATVTLDTTVPMVTVVNGPDLTKISKQAGKRLSTLVWRSDSDYQRYEVRCVPNAGSDHLAGVLIPATLSENTSGEAGLADVDVITRIDGADLETASPGDGNKVIKVFVQDLAGNWSD